MALLAAALSAGFAAVVTAVASASPSAMGGVKEVPDIHYGTDPSQVMDAFLPAETGQPTPAVIFVHGGGFTTGDQSSLFPEAKGVASVGWAGITINYRLAGYPDESNDVIAAATWVHDHPDCF